MPVLVVELAIGAQRNMFDAHTRARATASAGMYQAALEHANEAIQLSEMRQAAREEKMAIIVLDVVKRALKGLGERHTLLLPARAGLWSSLIGERQRVEQRREWSRRK